MMSKFLQIAALMLVITSCQKDLLPSELITWVEDDEHQLIQVQDFESFEFIAYYKPVDYVIAVESRTDELSTEDYHSKKRELEGLQYFDLKIKVKDHSGNAISGHLENEEDYYNRLDYFVTHAQYDIQLVQDTDTLWPKLYHFERNYGLAPYNTILLAFDDTKKTNHKTLIINDQVLGIGKIKFEFNENHISSTPELKLN